MTTQQLYLFNGLYLVVLLVVAVVTRATARRIAGAFAGGAAIGVVAHGDHLGAVLPDIDAHRFRRVCVHFPHHLANRPAVRLARAGGALGRLGGHRAAAGLLVHEAVSGMGRLWAGGRPCRRDLRELRPASARGAWGDAVSGRPGRCGPVSATSLRESMIYGQNQVRSASTRLCSTLT